jgi:hypothetical protein
MQARDHPWPLMRTTGTPGLSWSMLFFFFFFFFCIGLDSIEISCLPPSLDSQLS